MNEGRKCFLVQYKQMYENTTGVCHVVLALDMREDWLHMFLSHTKNCIYFIVIVEIVYNF